MRSAFNLLAITPDFKTTNDDVSFLGYSRLIQIEIHIGINPVIRVNKSYVFSKCIFDACISSRAQSAIVFMNNTHS